jgi:hypothetical protein
MTHGVRARRDQLTNAPFRPGSSRRVARLAQDEEDEQRGSNVEAIALAALGLIASTRRSPATRRRYCPAAERAARSCTRPGRSGSVRRGWSCQIHQSYGAVWG